MADNNRVDIITGENTERVSFASVFLRSIALFMSVVVVYTVVYLAFKGRALRTSMIDIPTGSTHNALNLNENNNHASSGEGNSDAVVDNAVLPENIDVEKMPVTVAEITAYYIKAHSRVKSEAKSVTKTYERTSNYKDVLETGNSAILSRIAKSIMNTFVKENTEPTLYEGAAAINEQFPPAGVACNLKPSDVESAKCVDKGSYYEIEIHTKPELNPKAGYGAGALGTILTKEQISSAVEGYVSISDVGCQYDDVYVIANVEKATGNMTYEYIHMPLYLSLTALNMKCNVGLLFEDKWEIQW